MLTHCLRPCCLLNRLGEVPAELVLLVGVLRVTLDEGGLGLLEVLVGLLLFALQVGDDVLPVLDIDVDGLSFRVRGVASASFCSAWFVGVVGLMGSSNCGFATAVEVPFVARAICAWIRPRLGMSWPLATQVATICALASRLSRITGWTFWGLPPSWNACAPVLATLAFQRTVWASR